MNLQGKEFFIDGLKWRIDGLVYGETRKGVYKDPSDPRKGIYGVMVPSLRMGCTMFTLDGKEFPRVVELSDILRFATLTPSETNYIKTLKIT